MNENQKTHAVEITKSLLGKMPETFTRTMEQQKLIDLMQKIAPGEHEFLNLADEYCKKAAVLMDATLGFCAVLHEHGLLVPEMLSFDEESAKNAEKLMEFISQPAFLEKNLIVNLFRESKLSVHAADAAIQAAKGKS